MAASFDTLRLANKCYARKQVTDDVTLIFEFHVHPLLRCSIWFVRSRDRDLLINTELGISSLKDEISDLTDKPLLALATHIHFDHVGCLHEFEHRLMHKSEAKLMADYQEFTFLKMIP